MEENSIINKAQAGFRRNYSTVDHIFTLLTLAQKPLLNHGKLHVVVIELKQAFDLVNRWYIWKTLRKNGIRVRMYRAVMSMYEIVKARVRVNGNVTEAFECSRGLKQGENCSPILFSLLINELANGVEQHRKHGITLSPYLIQILIMLLADDMLLISNTVVGLQQQLNILRNAAHKLNLLVNRDKSKIIINSRCCQGEMTI